MTTRNEIQKIWAVGSYQKGAHKLVTLWKVMYHREYTQARDYIEVVATDELDAYNKAVIKLKGKSCTE